jgi:glyoxylate/hydroxypyruvate reductase
MGSDSITQSGTAYPPSDLQSLLIMFPLSSAFSSALSAKFNLIDPSSAHSATALAILISGVIRVDSVFLDKYCDLKFVQTDSGGVNHIDLEECARRGILVANAGEVYSKDVADHAVGLLIDVLRRISAADRYIRRQSWSVPEDLMVGCRVWLLFYHLDFLYNIWFIDNSRLC